MASKVCLLPPYCQCSDHLLAWTAVIQVAKLSGFSPIITTASKSNEAFLKSLGVTDIIDRSVPLSDLPSAIAAITSAPIKVAFDALSLPDTQSAAYASLASGGQLVLVLENAIKDKVEDKETVQVLGDVHLLENRETGKSLFAKLTDLLAAGDIKACIHVFLFCLFG